MTREALRHQEPERRDLLRVGAAHIEGIEREYAHYGQLSCREIHLEEFIKPERCFELE